MSDTREPKAIIEAAERAANSGDFAAAERLLRKAADLQEANHGALHPDLANTLNNLGVVCEMNGDFDGAERCFRRAHEIAEAVLEPGHAIVATSRKNLEDFCTARGRPFVLPSSESKEATAAEVRISPLAPPEAAPEASVQPPPTTPPVPEARPQPKPLEEPKDAWRDPTPTTDPPKRAALTARSLEGRAIVIVLAVLALLAGYRWLQSGDSPETTASPRPAETAQDPPAETARTPPASQPAPETAPKATAPAQDTKPTPPPPAPKPEPKPQSTVASTAGTTGVSVVSAEVCRNLRTGSWKCDPLTSPVEPGQVYFYTRVKSPRDTVVLHRWFRDTRMIKSSELTIRANPGSGYRTYSRNTVSAGTWRVELRTKSGELLQEETFTVRD